MPVDARVCTGCKGSKVSCIGFIAGERRCQRCKRLDLECILAPARAKGAVRKLMKTSTLALLADDSHTRAPATVPNIADAGAVLTGLFAGAACLPSEATISEAVMSPHDGVSLEQRLLTLRMLLQSWARIGRQRNAYTLTAFVVYLCQKHKLHLAEVLGVAAALAPAQSDSGEKSPSGAAAPRLGRGGASDEGAALPYRYVLRRTCYDDQMVFEANEAFEQNVCSVAELDACWKRNNVEIKSLFGHPDDAQVYRTAAAGLWRRAMTGVEARVDGSAPVRVRVRTTPHSAWGGQSAAAAAAHTYTWCSLRASLAIMRGIDRVTFEWEPLPEQGPPTELEGETPPFLRAGAPAADGADGADDADGDEGAVHIDDGLLEELMGDDGDAALRHVGAAALRELEEHFGVSHNM